MTDRTNSEKYLEASRLISQAVQLLVSESSTSNTDIPDESSSANSESAQSQGIESEPGPLRITSSENPENHGSILPGFMSRATEVRRSASAELHDAFAPYSRQAYQFNRLGRGRRASTSSSSRQRRSSPFQAANTWTHKFCVIPYKDTQFTPTLQEKDCWKAAGLGEKTVTFARNGDYKAFEETLFDAFEALREAGGFLLLRSGRRAGSGENRQLELIAIPFGGYTARYLKFDSPLRSATCYVRPMQKDLPLRAPSTTSSRTTSTVTREVGGYFRTR